MAGEAVTVRVDDARTAAALRRCLAALLPAPAPDPPPRRPEYSLRRPDSSLRRPGSPGATGPRAFGTLSHGSCPLVRSESWARVVRALLAHLAARRPPPAGLVAVRAFTVTRDGRAFLAPGRWARLAGLDRRLADGLGARVADGPVALVDAARREVVVPEPSTGVAVDPAALADLLARGAPDPGDARAAAPGRYALGGWLVPGTPGERGAALLWRAAIEARLADGALADVARVLGADGAQGVPVVAADPRARAVDAAGALRALLSPR